MEQVMLQISSAITGPLKKLESLLEKLDSKHKRNGGNMIQVSSQKISLQILEQLTKKNGRVGGIFLVLDEWQTRIENSDHFNRLGSLCMR